MGKVATPKRGEGEGDDDAIAGSGCGTDEQRQGGQKEEKVYGLVEEDVQGGTVGGVKAIERGLQEHGKREQCEESAVDAARASVRGGEDED